MPLKPIFDKAPLIALTDLPLRPGQVRVKHEMMEQLYADMTVLTADQPLAWEGAFRLACLLRAKPMEEPCATWIRAALDSQGEDGGLPLNVRDAVAVMRAGLAMYELDARRPLLEKLVSWCGWAAAHWEDVLAERAVRTRPADLMELLQTLYRVTGKKALLTLCDRLRQQAMDWSGVLHTFAVQRPMARVTPWTDMEAGLEAEGGSEAGFYTRQYLTCHGESLADGMRSAALNGQFSGNGQELSAPRIGWEKISRYHGAVCGGLTADETIGGASPSCGVDAAALGAWAEALAGLDEENPWAWEALEALWVNGLPATMQNGQPVPYQRVNSLAVSCGTRDCYHVHEMHEQIPRMLNRLSRGMAKAASCAVTARPDGLSVNLYQPGRYAVPTADGVVLVHMEGGEGCYTLTLQAKQNVRATLRLRIPAWAENACVTVNDEGGEEGHPHTWLTLTRTWHSGDRIHVELPRRLTVSEGHHQSACIRYGAEVMAYVPTEDMWAVALCGEPEVIDGQVVAPVRHVPAWHKRGSVPADLPVLPDTDGETLRVVLTPYAKAPCRIALFPRGMKA